MRTVQIGSQSEYLRLTAADSAPEQLEANLNVEGLSASRTVFHAYATGFRGLADLFDNLRMTGADGQARVVGSRLRGI
jgi:hypothetical protein